MTTMAEVASAFVSLLPSAKGFGSKIDSQIGGEVESSGRRMGSRMGKSIIAPLAAAFGAIKVVDFFKDAVGEARESQKVGALTAQVIKSTGSAANITAAQVGKLATSISNKTGIDDEAIQSGSNLLLTFKNIRNEAGAGNDIFNQTTGIMTDMATAMGTEPKAAAIQLGKALNDPIKGITALSRVGVTFTEGQKKQIKAMVESGNVMGAQKLILKELNSEFGGAAAAQATAGDKARVAWGNFKEEIGTALLPVVDKLATLFTSRVVPALSQFVKGLVLAWGVFRSGDDIAQGLGETLDYALGNTGRFVAPIIAIVAAMQTLAGATMATVKWFNEHRTVTLSLAAAIGALVVVTQVHAAVLAVTAAGGLAAMIKSIPVVVSLTRVWAAVQWALNLALSANPIGLVIIAIAALVAGLVLAWKKSETFRRIVIGAWSAVKLATSNAWDAMTSAVSSGISDVVGFVKSLPRRAVSALGSLAGMLWDTATAAFGRFLSGVRNSAGDAVDFVRGLPDKIVNALGDAGQMLWGVGVDIVQGLLGGLRSMASSITSTLIGLLPGPLKKFAGKLGIASPSKVFKQFGVHTVEGYVLGLQSMQRPLDQQMAALAPVPPRVRTYTSRLDLVPTAARSTAGSSGSDSTVDLAEAIRAQTVELKAVIYDQPRLTAERLKMARI